VRAILACQLGQAGPVEWGVLLTRGESVWHRDFGLLRRDNLPEVMLQGG
jgi:hypothetical protein